MTQQPGLSSRITGSLLGGALGEARADSFSGRLAFANATQLTLYTVDGLTEALEWANDGVAADETACLWLAYLRWLGTQGEAPPSSAPAPPPRWIDAQEVLRRRRQPDAATLDALRSGEMGSRQRPLEPYDDGPGALQRSAPFGLMANVPVEMIERLTLDAAAITHGNGTAQSSAAVFARLIHELAVNGQPLAAAVDVAADYASVLPAADLAQRLGTLLAGPLSLPNPLPAQRDAPTLLLTAVSLVLATADDDGGAHAAAAFGAVAGLADSGAAVIGALAGNILGALHGKQAIPADELERLEGAGVVSGLAERFASAMGA